MLFSVCRWDSFIATAAWEMRVKLFVFSECFSRVFEIAVVVPGIVFIAVPFPFHEVLNSISYQPFPYQSFDLIFRRFVIFCSYRRLFFIIGTSERVRLVKGRFELSDRNYRVDCHHRWGASIRTPAFLSFSLLETVRRVVVIIFCSKHRE